MMKRPGLVDVEASALTHMTEEEYAGWRKDESGTGCFMHRGRYWRRSRLGFCVPVHPIARLSADEATKPPGLSLGFRAALTEEARWLANSTMGYYILSDLKGYGVDTLPSKRRTKLRKCRKHVRIAWMKGLAFPAEEVYRVVSSAAERTGYWPPAKNNYLEDIEKHFSDERQFVLAGIVDGKLAAILEGVAVGGTAYSQYLFIASEYLSTEVGTGLVFEFSQVCRRTPVIKELTYGPHERYDKKINAFKEEMGFPLVNLPIKYEINPILEKFMRWRNPENFYRNTGIG